MLVLGMDDTGGPRGRNEAISVETSLLERRSEYLKNLAEADALAWSDAAELVCEGGNGGLTGIGFFGLGFGTLGKGFLGCLGNLRIGAGSNLALQQKRCNKTGIKIAKTRTRSAITERAIVRCLGNSVGVFLSRSMFEPTSLSTLAPSEAKFGTESVVEPSSGVSSVGTMFFTVTGITTVEVAISLTVMGSNNVEVALFVTVTG